MAKNNIYLGTNLNEDDLRDFFIDILEQVQISVDVEKILKSEKPITDLYTFLHTNRDKIELVINHGDNDSYPTSIINYLNDTYNAQLTLKYVEGIINSENNN